MPLAVCVVTVAHLPSYRLPLVSPVGQLSRILLLIPPHPHPPPPHPHPHPPLLGTAGGVTVGGVGMSAKYEKVLVGNFNTPSLTAPVPIGIHVIPSSLRSML